MIVSKGVFKGVVIEALGGIITVARHPLKPSDLQQRCVVVCRFNSLLEDNPAVNFRSVWLFIGPCRISSPT